MPLIVALGSAAILMTLSSGPALAQKQAGPTPLFVGTFPGLGLAEQQIHQGAQAAAKALHVNLDWFAPASGAVSDQLTATESALSLPNLKGLSVVAADPNSLEGVMRQAKAKGIAISQLSACTPKATAPICYSTDFEKAGQEVAQKMATLMNGSGKVVIATGIPGDVNHQLRVKGFTEYMKAHDPKIQIVQTIPNCDSADTTVQCAETALSAHPDLTGYYATGAAAADGAASVFPKAGKHVIVSAVDDDPTTISGIKKGSISFTYVQQLWCGGYLMVLLPYEQAFKGLVPHQKFVDTGIAFVDKSNVNTYKAAQTANCNKLINYINTKVMK
jgi:ribose transport system substrate-binding protein